MSPQQVFGVLAISIDSSLRRRRHGSGPDLWVAGRSTPSGPWPVESSDSGAAPCSSTKNGESREHTSSGCSTGCAWASDQRRPSRALQFNTTVVEEADSDSSASARMTNRWPSRVTA